MDKEILRQIMLRDVKSKLPLMEIVADIKKQENISNKALLAMLLEAINLNYLDIAKMLKQLNPNIDVDNLAEKLYEALKDEGSYITALEFGTILLNEDIFPNTTKDKLEKILLKLNYKQEDINLAIKHLYAIYITLSAREKWKDTGIILAENEVATVKYVSGLWTANPALGRCDARGISSCKAKIGYTLPGENEGALIGKIVVEEIKPFLIGKEREIVNNYQRKLYLCINDDLDKRYGAGFADNAGELELEIKISFR